MRFVAAYTIALLGVGIPFTLFCFFLWKTSGVVQSKRPSQRLEGYIGYDSIHWPSVRLTFIIAGCVIGFSVVLSFLTRP
mgnify:CR=1 FL=1